MSQALLGVLSRGRGPCNPHPHSIWDGCVSYLALRPRYGEVTSPGRVFSGLELEPRRRDPEAVLSSVHLVAQRLPQVYWGQASGQGLRPNPYPRGGLTGRAAGTAATPRAERAARAEPGSPQPRAPVL